MKPLILAVAFATLFFACQKESSLTLNQNPEETGAPYTGKSVQASFQGRVLTESGEPVSGAKVAVGTATTFTNQYGIFSLNDVETDHQFGYVTVEKTGFLPGSRTVWTQKNSMNFVEVRLMDKILKGSFESAVAATVSVEDAVTIKFPDHAVATSSGAEYTGKVNVYASMIDPSAENFSGIMPGDLRGVRTDNSISALVSYGMIAVELEGESGEKLQLQTGKNASISMKIPQNLAASAPASIPMWHFDVKGGYWVEEGAGVKSGSSYIGEVSHFSTWNFDVPANFIKLSLRLLRPEGEAVPYKEVKVYDADNTAYYNTALTDSSGSVQMWVPINTELKIKVVGSCNKLLDSTVVGPFNIDTDLGSVNVSSSTGTIVKGKVVDCNDMPVTDGIVKLFLEGLNYRVLAENGEFTMNLDLCLYSGELKGSIKAESSVLLQQSELQEVTVASGVNDIGTLKICSDIDPLLVENATVTVGSNAYSYNSILDSFTTNLIGPYTFIKIFGNNAGGDIYSKALFLELPDTIPGTYVRSQGSYIVGPDSIPYNTSFSLNNGDERYRLFLSDTITWNITQYGLVGDMIEATFSLKSVEPGITDVKIPASGHIRFRREH